VTHKSAIVAFVMWLLVPAGSFAEDRAQDRALNWISEHLRESNGFQDRDRAAIAAAQTAIDRARAAIGLAQQYKDDAAGSVAQNALAIAHSAKSLAEVSLSHHQAASGRLEQVLRSAAGGRGGAVATRFSGRVMLQRPGKGPVAWDGAGMVEPGDTIVLGADAMAELAVLDGGWLALGPNSSFTFSAPAKAGWTYDLAGEIHYLRTHSAESERLRSSDLRYRTSYTVNAIRGTEFELHTRPGQPDVYVPIDGKISLTATAAAALLHPDSAGLEMKRPWAPLAAESLARISEAQGSVQLRTAAGKVIPASQGLSLQAGDEITTGPGASAVMDLARNYQIALAPDSRLIAAAEKASAKPLYALRQGHARIRGNGETGPTFLTPNTVGIPQAREFEITVGDGGLAHIALREGSLEISAVASRIDRSKLDPWWEK
jgi:hypothetical protein